MCYKDMSEQMPILVIGDKKAGHSVRVVSDNQIVLQRLQDIISPLPLVMIHCVRHPFDCIASRSIRSQTTLELASQRYFEVERMVVEVSDHLAAHTIYRIYLEKLIESPRECLGGILNLLGLDFPCGFLDVCQSLIMDSPHRTRSMVSWSNHLKAEIVEQMQSLKRLHQYSDEMIPKN